MLVRLGFVPAVAFSVLASVGTAAAQYYPVEGQDPAAQGGSAYDAAGSRAIENVEVPAAYDPYGAPANGAPAQTYQQPQGAYGQPQAAYGAPPPGVRDPYAAPAPGVPAVANAPYADPSRQPTGYPPGAYSGQPPAGMASPYGSQAAAPQPAQQPSSSQPNYGQPAAYGQPPAPVQGSGANTYGANGSSVAMLPPEDQPEEGPPKELPPHLKHQVVDYVTKEAPGTIVIDTPNTYLYYVLPGGKAERYGIGVGREGFTWAGSEKISRKAEWPDWRPPAEMIERQPYLPRFMAGGPGNPMGARALYLGGTIYRIHGTNQPSTIGQFMSSGCIRMLNEDVESLFDKVKVGTKVVVLPGNPPATAGADGMPPTAAMPAADTGFAVR
ncbi:Lipoprotein-anchoring transpeptidase ErfK/SrfK [Ancylobacter rudongensis]|uniref:Lipoprotein-anchoring transpeptidase ErfK/SrfK n=2 Tax=Ancylobacter rudongensis TaxID=177413 RepID=A0A1G4PT48_9HYPH|nr:Lipoprotein-anchoring transpeptidase ErfK/SrfK [Ancylobacter rudongensis]